MKTVTFPNLGLEFNLNRVAFSIFGIDIYWYALIIVTGIVLAYLYCVYESKREGLNSDVFSDVLIIGIPSAIIGARLYYVIFRWDYYSENLSQIFNLREGGIAIYGAVIFGALAVFLYLKHKKISVLKIFDIASIGLFIGQGMGRWGNFVNVEAFGYETNSFFKMGIESAGKIIYVHPTFLYESVWNFISAGILMWLIRRKKFDGQIFLLYIMMYGIGRFIIEGLRTDSLMFFNIRISQLVAVVSVITALVIYIIKLRNKNKICGE